MTHPQPHAEPVSDESLARSAAQGDAAALEALLTRQRPWIFNIALRMVHDPEDAEDVTQEVLVKIGGAVRGFEGRSGVRTWMYRIVANHVLNMRRRRAEQETTSFNEFGAALDGMDNAEPPDPAPDGPELPLILREVEFSCTRGMLLCLSREQRLAFILGSILGISSPEAGEAMGISSDHFRQLLARARRDLFAFMQDKCGLINQANPCRCAYKTRAFIAAGVVDPGRLQFADETLRRVEEEAPAVIDAMDELERRYAATFRKQPFARPTRAGPLNRALDEFRRIGLG